MSVLSVAWRDILFAHWSVAPESVETHLPAGIGLDADDRLGVAVARRLFRLR